MATRSYSASLAITSLGMVSSAGRDVATACAAIRAGMSRPQDVDSLPLLDEDTCEESNLSAHPVLGFSEGFVLAGCWIRLALAALDDLADYGRLPSPEDHGFWQRTGLLVAVPVLPEKRFGEGGDDRVALRESYLLPLVGLWGRPLAPGALGLVEGGNAAALIALKQASADLAGHVIDRAIILAADSYLDDLSLDWLRATRRLKTPDNPVGLAPGEAAACVLVERSDVARGRGARLEGLVRAAAVGREPKAFVQGEMSLGETLAPLMRACIEQTGRPLPLRGQLIADLNGEPWRAQQLGAALTKTSAALAVAGVACPATSLGDTGAASGAVALCCAIRALVRGYSAGPVLTLSSCVDGHVGVACLDRPGTAGKEP